jgi:hypothetical protein
MRPCLSVSTAAVLGAIVILTGPGLSTVQAQQNLQSRPATFQAGESDDHLAELTPTAFTADQFSQKGPSARHARRQSLLAQQHYQSARAAALAHHTEVYERECAQALAVIPASAEIFLLRATQEIAAAHYDAALWNIAYAQLLQPRIAFSETLLASVFNGMRRYEDAFLVLRDLPAPEAESWQAIYERARAEVGMGNRHGSELWSQRVLTAAPPTFAETHLVRGEALALSARWEDARSELNLYLQSGADQRQRSNALADLARLDTLAKLPPQ